MRDRRPDETDDVPRIQEAINEAAKASADIEIPAGHYVIGSTLHNVQHVSGEEDC